jgi:hypothetical protein
VVSGVEPWTSLLRAFVAFVVGMVGTQIWYVFFATRIEYSKEEERGQGS